MNYAKIYPIERHIPADRQSAKRHYGVHPYFTRRPYNVVRDYILNYSEAGDRVLDPFGGSGVTAIESFLENRVGIQNDINPLANFIARGIAELANGNMNDYEKALATIKEKCASQITRFETMPTWELENFSKKLRLPENIALPKTADVANYFELFSLRQLVALTILRKAVDELESEHTRKGMLLAWSATLAKLNRTFLSAEGRAESRGGSSIFSIYRYKVAKEPVELPAWETFYERAKNILKAKGEIDQAIQLKKQTGGWCGRMQFFSKDVEELSEELSDSIDYIFTDPPYGGHISYLDLSILWNSWLGLTPDLKTREKELIVGGELSLSEEHYLAGLRRSVQACLKMLKKSRWLSIVFQHWNTAYFEAILSAAAESGAELKAAVPQIGDTIWSMHKKKNGSVLAGEMILTFCKTGKIKTLETERTFDVAQFLFKLLDNTHQKEIFAEYIFNELVIEAWKQSALKSLRISRNDFIGLLEKAGWIYETNNHCWIKQKHQPHLLFT